MRRVYLVKKRKSKSALLILLERKRPLMCTGLYVILYPCWSLLIADLHCRLSCAAQHWPALAQRVRVGVERGDQLLRFDSTVRVWLLESDRLMHQNSFGLVSSFNHGSTNMWWLSLIHPENSLRFRAACFCLFFSYSPSVWLFIYFFVSTEEKPKIITRKSIYMYFFPVFFLACLVSLGTKQETKSNSDDSRIRPC